MADTLYLATLDAHLVALDAHTGAVRWDVEVADLANGYSLTCAPLAIKDLVLVGTAGGEFRSKGYIPSTRGLGVAVGSFTPFLTQDSREAKRGEEVIRHKSAADRLGYRLSRS